MAGCGIKSFSLSIFGICLPSNYCECKYKSRRVSAVAAQSTSASPATSSGGGISAADGATLCPSSENSLRFPFNGD